MIPKIIHYCWFGLNPKVKLVEDCIESWKKYFPNYQIVEWNENNFNIECCKYVKEAYECRKWAFVSDYVRFYVLYNYGGVYLDTDVEVIRSFDDLIELGPFMGREYHNSFFYPLNPGLGFAMEKGDYIVGMILREYENMHFVNKDGSMSKKTIVDITTSIMKNYGLEAERNIYQEINGIKVYPSDFFSPQNMFTGCVEKTENTRSIHYYVGSWDTITIQKGLEIKRKSVAKYGKKIGKIIYLIKYSIYIIINDGFGELLKKVVER